MSDGQPDFALLPEELQHLGPLVARYAEADDVKRSRMLANASDEELRLLSDAPGAHWHAINAYLDRHVAAGPGPEQDVAVALDAFAQAAMEARTELDHRG